jgi:hypothetical protein
MEEKAQIMSTANDEPKTSAPITTSIVLLEKKSHEYHILNKTPYPIFSGCCCGPDTQIAVILDDTKIQFAYISPVTIHGLRIKAGGPPFKK